MATRDERIRGGVLGLVIGDALGAPFEGQTGEWIGRRYPHPQALLTNPPGDGLASLCYTDDGQMAIALTEALLAHPEPTVDDYARAYVADYEPWRGYGRGARRVLEALGRGVAPAEAARACFPDGSFGNGAAMRVAPVGLRWAEDPTALLEQARRSALPTHCHPDGIEGALLLARAVAWAVRAEAFDREAFFADLDPVVSRDGYRAQLELARTCQPGDLAQLGNEISALRSVPTCLAAFACFPDSYVDAVGSVILLGGDTDTLAAMTGALSGAFLGRGAIPTRLVDMLEDDAKGQTHVQILAGRLAMSAT